MGWDGMGQDGTGQVAAHLGHQGPGKTLQGDQILTLAMGELWDKSSSGRGPTWQTLHFTQPKALLAC